ncbi:MAG: hypothetical protein U0521_28185 [Anaerolineae bacterium]
MRKYRASNRVPFGSFLILLVLAVIGGAAVGGILWAVDAMSTFIWCSCSRLSAGRLRADCWRAASACGQGAQPIHHRAGRRDQRW